MKTELDSRVYPIVIRKQADGYYLVKLLDFDYETQGTSISDSISMARDLIGMLAIEYFNKGKELPNSFSCELQEQDGDINKLVDIDLKDYFKQYGSIQ